MIYRRKYGTSKILIDDNGGERHFGGHVYASSLEEAQNLCDIMNQGVVDGMIIGEINSETGEEIYYGEAGQPITKEEYSNTSYKDNALPNLTMNIFHLEEEKTIDLLHFLNELKYVITKRKTYKVKNVNDFNN
jgi:hypothetical protein